MLALSWSGGKDCAMALGALRAAGRSPEVLLTTVDEAGGDVPLHRVGAALLEAQAAAVGLPLVRVAIPPAASNVSYEQRLGEAFAAPPLDAVDAVAFGDLFLEDVRAYREGRMAEAGLEAVFPLWGLDTAAQARAFVDDGFRATVVCVDSTQAPPALLGRPFDAAFLRDLPASADLCGENGEFHTFVTDGPGFATPVEVVPGARTADDRFAWLALELAGRPVSA